MGVLNHFRFRSIPALNISRPIESVVKTPIGGVLENYLLIETLQESPNTTGYKKKQSGTEIDFILNFYGLKVPAECKSSIKSKLTHARGLIEYKRTYQIKHAILFNLAEPAVLKSSDGVTVQSLPLYLAPILHRLVPVQ